jgi:hypothetical protein
MDVRSPTHGTVASHSPHTGTARRHQWLKSVIKVVLVLLTLAAIVAVSVALVALFTGDYR